jgi:hypothetical protein
MPADAHHQAALDMEQSITKLVSYLRDLGESVVSNLWDNLDRRRNGGWYGHQTMLPVVLEVAGYWRDIRTWALS